MQVLFRKSLGDTGEFDVCSQVCSTVEQRSDCYNSLVVGRYSVLPYYKELEVDLERSQCKLINSYKQHKWIADFTWYKVLSDYTPQTWFSDYDAVNSGYSGPFFIKGKTNSRKHQWDTHAYAKDIPALHVVANNLRNDSMIGYQDLVFRKFEPLEVLEYGLHGLPFSNEWRFFYIKGKCIGIGYYWSIAEKTDYQIDADAIVFANRVAKLCMDYTTFFVLDIAKTKDGRWILIEVNDGQCSGLSTIDPKRLYTNLNIVTQWMESGCANTRGKSY